MIRTPACILFSLSLLCCWVGFTHADDQPQSPVAPTVAAPTIAPAPFTVQPAAQVQTAVIGSNDPATGFKAQYHLTAYGAGIWWATLTDYQYRPLQKEPYAVLTDQLPSGTKTAVYHLAARSIVVNGYRYDLAGVPWQLVTPQNAGQGSAVYRITLVDAQSQPVLDIERTFTLEPKSYDLQCTQQLTNRSSQPLIVRFEQNGPADIAADETGYMGDRREFIAGYFNLSYDPGRTRIYIDNTLAMRSKVLDERRYWPTKNLPAQYELVWLANVNRYFAVAVHPIVPNTLNVPAQVPALGTVFPQENVGLQVTGQFIDSTHDHRTAVLTLASRDIELPAGQSVALGVSLFAGPRSPSLFEQPPYKALGLDHLVIYNLGGICAFCTFQWLANGLFLFLNAIHFVLRDWSLAIIVLVIVVRGLLHPITRRAQINMMKMQKQMASLAPEIEKLKKKYKDEPQKLQSEQMRLYREKGVNPLGMLGCLPMFLQMPIWIALYAMLYYAIELRHTEAFYGVFQAVTGDRWGFMADLSRADHFISFPLSWHFTVPLLGIPIDGLHILPFLMAVVFFLQFKYTTPPAANEQAAQQQKIMKWMTLLFPVFLYAAPSGLNLYILASTGAGILDSYIVKQHIKREEEAGTLLENKGPSKMGGWMERMQKMIEERQKQTGTPDGLPPRKK